MKRIYLDYAAITPIDKGVLKVMKEYSRPCYGNASSLYEEGVKARKALEKGRRETADFFGAHADEIIFTASGTEANNIALSGVIETALARGNTTPHVITSQIEHASVLETLRAFEKKGVKVDYVGVDEKGIVSPDEIKKKLNSNTCLVSLMMVNNEIGTIQPIREVAKVIRHHYAHAEKISSAKIFFHTDASQAPLYLPLEVEKLGVDMITIDGHKIHGPRGIGALYIRRGTPLATFIHGGGQEKGIRSGTENLPSIMGFAFALSLAKKLREKESKRVEALRDYCIEKLVAFSGIVLNGDAHLRIPHNINISIPDIDNEFLVLMLDASGIACSTKSSCLRDEHDSYVIRALGTSGWQAKNSIRFTLGRETRRQDIDHLLASLKKILIQH